MNHGNLLIVDDEPDLLMVLEYSLKKYADQILKASNGADALKVIASHNVHCILCDMHMPIMNGMELIMNLRKEKLYIPFIFYTGHASLELMLEVQKYGALDYLDKPRLEGLEKAIQRGLRQGLGKDDITIEAHEFESEFRKLIMPSSKT